MHFLIVISFRDYNTLIWSQKNNISWTGAELADSRRAVVIHKRKYVLACPRKSVVRLNTWQWLEVRIRTPSLGG